MVFDKVPHERLIKIVKICGIQGKLASGLKNGRKQSVIVIVGFSDSTADQGEHYSST